MDARFVKAAPFRFLALCAALCAALFGAFMCAGCAALPWSGSLGTASTAISLGSLGQTLVNVTYMDDGGHKTAVARLPANYRGNMERMLCEAWEQHYQYVKCVRWQDEDIPWQDLARTSLRKGRGDTANLVLVETSPVAGITSTEERTFYATASGRLVRDPAEAAGESYYPHTRTQQYSVPRYVYSAFFFTRSRQPSGLLLGASPPGPCGPGALVRAVGKKSAGENAGLRSGDIITQINGRNADPKSVFSLLVSGANTVRVCRNGAYAARHLHIP